MATRALACGVPDRVVVTFVVEGINPAPHIHEHLRYTNYGYGTAYTFTHNNIMLEHTAMNDKNTITHTDAYNTQY